MDPQDVEKFCRNTEEYYINCYTLNFDRITDLAAHGITLHKQLVRAVAQIRLLNAELTSLRTTKENA
jgi:hypothetical protein